MNTYPNYGLYVNGVKISEDKRIANPVTFVKGNIGEWDDRGSMRFFYGKMKEFRIWNKICCEQEINKNMLKAAKPNWMEQGLIMYFSLDDPNNVRDWCYQYEDENQGLVTNDFKLDQLNIV